MSPSYRLSYELRADLGRVARPALGAGVLLLLASIIGAFFSPNDFFRSYLIGYLYILALSLGSMAYLMIQYLSGGAWGIVSRRTLEAATRTLPLVAVLFAPIGFGLHYLYGWSRPEIVRYSQTLSHRAGYMNPAFFLARAGIYLVVWNVFAYLLNRWSAEQDRSPGRQSRLLTRLSAGGAVFYIFSISFAAVLLGLWAVVVTIYPVFQYFKYERTGGLEPSKVLVPLPPFPPQPRLQEDPAADLEQFRARENAELNSYRWVDRARGIASIPIARAIQIVARQGIPPSLPGGKQYYTPQAGSRETGFEGKVEPIPR